MPLYNLYNRAYRSGRGSEVESRDEDLEVIKVFALVVGKDLGTAGLSSGNDSLSITEIVTRLVLTSSKRPSW